MSDTIVPENRHLKVVADEVQKQLVRLAPAEITVPRRYSLYTLPDQQFPTECFGQACYYMQTHRIKGMEYVFGRSLGGGLGNHGWVELPGNVLFDGVLQRFYDRSEYYRIEFAMPWYRYTRTAVLWLLEQLKRDDGTINWRWDLTLGLPWANSAHDRNVQALLLDRKAAQKYLAKAEENRRSRR
jgi:hypothetical protein